MSTVTRSTSAEELIKLPPGRARYELLRGELRAMSPSGSEHGVVSANLGRMIGQFVSAHGLGIVFGAETGFLLERNPDTVLAPDAAFIRNERVPQSGPPKGYWPGPPDLAIEVASPNDTPREVAAKAAAWLTAGTRTVWIVNPEARSVAAHQAGEPTVTLAAHETLRGGDVLPGFECPVSSLFWQH